MSKKLLITLGCSWTYGVGVCYQPGMSKKDFIDQAWNPAQCDQHSFRGILSRQFNMHNVNLSLGGSSNQAQFRLAENFFSSDQFNQLSAEYNDIQVLWGITSILRNEMFINQEQRPKSVFYTDGSLLSKVIITDYFNEQHEVLLLRDKIKFWNDYFSLKGINNHWFDTFNHHAYNDCLPTSIKQTYITQAGSEWPSWEKFSNGNCSDVPEQIMNEILNPERWDFYKYFYQPAEQFFSQHNAPRDLMSQLAIKHGIPNLDYGYHTSHWSDDNTRVKFLTDLGLLNPYSYHPTMQAHKEIANMLEELFSG